MKFQVKVISKVSDSYVQIAVAQNGIVHNVFVGSDVKTALKNAASIGKKLKLGFSSVSDFELI